jgi:hypothetical protein
MINSEGTPDADWGTGGPEFKSRRSDQSNQRLSECPSSKRAFLGRPWKWGTRDENITINQATGLAPEENSPLKGDPAAPIFARTVVLTPDGLMILNLTREAAEDLATELQIKLRA